MTTTRLGLATARIAIAAARPAAQTLWRGKRGDRCGEIRCLRQLTNNSPTLINVALPQRSGAIVTTKVGLLRSLCGPPGVHKDDTLGIAPGASDKANHTSQPGNMSDEAFVPCGSARCADVVTVSASSSEQR